MLTIQKQRSYIAKKGDTLASIAMAHGTGESVLQELNANLPGKIVGLEIFVPGTVAIEVADEPVKQTEQTE